ncbi:beta-taxilin-like isoform X1 [Xyrichtys novacula]|uniref:Beta-taxilin-like isoform X1 n=1 Tax=Xyrichtys novacula TaxID=13765 RepID=A0AAV1GXD3_XYRNO|nr:beta-taxilin-like isoform X1 [Xyrichtys novacula]
MEASVKTAKVLVPPQPAENPDGEEAAAACASLPSPTTSSFSEFADPMEEFSRQLEDIISTYSSTTSILDKQSAVEAEMEKMKKEAKEDIAAAIESEASLIKQKLNKLSSSEKKLEDLVRKYAELAAQRRADEKKLSVLQQSFSLLLDERQQLQAESRSSVTARSKLEGLCRELQGHYSRLRDQTLRRCREDEEKRNEMTGHFQTMLTEIQAQIEQHSNRNDKLCRENTILTEKLEGLMNQCEMREESLEKINERRDLQHKLTEAKLQQANALLTEAEEKHKREKEYLLREAIDKTKKCFAMKEQELTMKKKLALYAQKFDEFQDTLAKSNEIYVRFKKEMDNMSDKMKKMDKESNLWKTRFENCNKALTDMIEERAEKNKEYELFVLKIQKLEKLCRALQEERVVLYDKIKEVRISNANLPSKIFSSSNKDETPDTESAKSALLTPDMIQELEQIQQEDPVLTENMTRLREEQAKLTEFAASLLATPSNDEEGVTEDVDPEEDVVSSAFKQFKTKTQVTEEAVSAPKQVVEEKSDTAEKVPQPVVEKPEAPAPVEDTPEMTPTNTKPEVENFQTQINNKEEKTVKPDQQKPAETAPTPKPEKVKTSPPADTKSEAEKVQTQIDNKEEKPVKPDQQEPSELVSSEKVKTSPPTGTKPEVTEAEIKPVVPVEDQKVQPKPVQAPEEAPTKSDSAPPSKNTPKASAPSNAESSKKQMPKKKKKRNAKTAS